MIRRAALIVMLIVTIVGCGHPLVPKSALTPPHSASASPHKVTASIPEPAVIGANGPVLGVNLYALRNYSAAQVEDDGTRMLSYIRDVLHADAVDIVWNFYQTSPYSNSVVATSDTLSAANVAILTHIAQQDHLLVSYRPLIMIDSPSPWEGHVAPVSPTRWFDNYYMKELPYLELAQTFGINEFVAATEMVKLNNSPLWQSFFARAGQIYHGTISYAAHEFDYFPPGTHLLPAKQLGVDMYESLNLPPTASSARVTAAYGSFFSQMPASVLRRTAIDETGIAARAGAYQIPSSLGDPGYLDETVQLNWFTAACNTVKKYHLRAVFFWKVDLTDYPITHPASSLSTFEGKKGAQAISGCAGVLHG